METEYFPLIAQILSAKAVEPCQSRNAAALRFNFRVFELCEGGKYDGEIFFHLSIGSGTAFIFLCVEGGGEQRLEPYAQAEGVTPFNASRREEASKTACFYNLYAMSC